MSGSVEVIQHLSITLDPQRELAIPIPGLGRPRPRSLCCVSPPSKRTRPEVDTPSPVATSGLGFCLPRPCLHDNANTKYGSATTKTRNSNNGMLLHVILPNDLAQRMTKPKPFLLLDCRPFLAYNNNHIYGALNLNCTDRLNKRRLMQGRISVADLVASKDGRDLFRKRMASREVILYDDNTSDVSHITPSHSLYPVVNFLQKEGKIPTLLKGMQKIVHNILLLYL